MFATPRHRAPPPPSKKRKRPTPTIEEIKFDALSRTDYLTGFHRRKQARIKHAREVSAQKDREEKIRMRKVVREGREREVAENVRAAREGLRRVDFVMKDGVVWKSEGRGVGIFADDHVWDR